MNRRSPTASTVRASGRIETWLFCAWPMVHKSPLTQGFSGASRSAVAGACHRSWEAGAHQGFRVIGAACIKDVIEPWHGLLALARTLLGCRCRCRGLIGIDAAVPAAGQGRLLLAVVLVVLLDRAPDAEPIARSRGGRSCHPDKQVVLIVTHRDDVEHTVVSVLGVDVLDLELEIESLPDLAHMLARPSLGPVIAPALDLTLENTRVCRDRAGQDANVGRLDGGLLGDERQVALVVARGDQRAGPRQGRGAAGNVFSDRPAPLARAPPVSPGIPTEGRGQEVGDLVGRGLSFFRARLATGTPAIKADASGRLSEEDLGLKHDCCPSSAPPSLAVFTQGPDDVWPTELRDDGSGALAAQERRETVSADLLVGAGGDGGIRAIGAQDERLGSPPVGPAVIDRDLPLAPAEELSLGNGSAGDLPEQVASLQGLDHGQKVPAGERGTCSRQLEIKQHDRGPRAGGVDDLVVLPWAHVRCRRGEALDRELAVTAPGVHALGEDDQLGGDGGALSCLGRGADESGGGLLERLPCLVEAVSRELLDDRLAHGSWLLHEVCPRGK